jgi:membrane protease subunit (stomatin/prohibitin family)
MTKIPFPANSAIKEFDATLQQFISDLQTHNTYKLLNPRNVETFSHGTGWRTHSGDENAKELSSMEKHSTEYSIKYQEIINHNIDMISATVNHIVKNMNDQLMSTMYTKLSQSTEKSGNIVSVTEVGSNKKAFIKMLQKIEFGVDENGNASLPQLHIAPDNPMINELNNPDAEFETEVQKVINEKSAAALLREQERLAKYNTINE